MHPVSLGIRIYPYLTPYETIMLIIHALRRLCSRAVLFVRHWTAKPRAGRWRIAAYAGCLALTAICAGCSLAPESAHATPSTPLKPVTVDLPRYMGTWYVISNIPYFAENGFVGSRVEWRLRADGKISDTFIGHRSSFTAPESRYHFVDTPLPENGNGVWRVRLFWPIYVSQITLYVDPDYRYTILGYPGRKLGWIFARSPQISDADYRSLLQRLRDLGYDPNLFRKIPQIPPSSPTPQNS